MMNERLINDCCFELARDMLSIVSQLIPAADVSQRREVFAAAYEATGIGKPDGLRAGLGGPQAAKTSPEFCTRKHARYGIFTVPSLAGSMCKNRVSATAARAARTATSSTATGGKCCDTQHPT
jgi:hypothetical protein